MVASEGAYYGDCSLMKFLNRSNFSLSLQLAFQINIFEHSCEVSAGL